MKHQLTGAAIFVILCGSALAGDRAPLPEKLVAAKTVFIENKSGEPGFADAMFARLQEWGRWRVVTSRADADVVIELDHRDIFIHNFFSLSVVDRQSGDLLWVRKKDVGFRAWGGVSRRLLADLRKQMPGSAAAAP